jgi:hypothetical protein
LPPVNPPGSSLADYVTYTGATQNVDLGEFGVEAGFVTLDTTPTNTPTAQGTIFWDADDNTVDVVLNGYIMKIGEDLFYPVKNQTGSNIPKGRAVRFAGTLGASGRLLVAPFIADGSVPSTFFMGVTAEAIANGADGKVLYFGRIRGMNTLGFEEGDVLYASTTTAGGFQTAVPVAPNNIVQVAAVINKSITQGVIFVRPSFGSNINQDEGVKIVSPTTGQLLQLQSNGLWENKTKAQVLGGTSSQFVKGDGTLDSNTYQVTSEKGQPNGYASLDSNGKVPLAQINDALIGNVNFQGLWNAATNTPTLANPPASGTKGYYYIVSTAGTFAGISFEVGDWIISSGSAWQKIDNTDAVSSVFGRTGNVVASNGDYTTAQVTESGNLYYTEARVNANTNVAANTAARHNAVTLGTANGLSLSTQVLSLGLASAGVTGALSGTDWTTFNNKANSVAGGYLPLSGGTMTGPLTISGLGYGNTLVITTSNIGGADIRLTNTSAGGKAYSITSTGSNNALGAGGLQFYNETDGVVAFGYTSSRNFLINTSTDAGFRLDVNGTGRFSGLLAVQNSRLGLGIRSSGRGELFLNSSGTDFVSEIFFGFGNGYNEDNIRWALSDRGTTTGDLVFFAGPANGGFSSVLSLNKTGAATFSSSVTGRNFVINEASANRGGLYPYNLVLGSGTDYSTGIFSEGEIFLASGGSATKRFTLASTGAATFSSRVGVAGAAATYPITVYNASNGTTAAFGGTARGIRIDNDGTFSSGRSTIFGVDSSFYGSYQPLSIEASSLVLQAVTGGNVLIGTTTDNGNRLQVNGTVDFLSGTNNTTYLRVGNNSARQLLFSNFNVNISTANAGHRLNASDSSGAIALATAGTDRLFINSSGETTLSNLSGSGNRIVVANSGGTLVSAVIGSGLAFDGTTLTATGGSSGSISGSGNSGFIPIFTGATSIGNSKISDNGTTILISSRTDIVVGGQGIAFFPNLGSVVNRIETSGSAALPLALVTNGNLISLAAGGTTPQFTVTSGNNVLIGTTTVGGSRLRVVGLPTSSSGLSAGDVWNSSGTLRIV